MVKVSFSCNLSDKETFQCILQGNIPYLLILKVCLSLTLMLVKYVFDLHPLSNRTFMDPVSVEKVEIHS